MHRASFWQLVEILTQAGRVGTGTAGLLNMDAVRDQYTNRLQQQPICLEEGVGLGRGLGLHLIHPVEYPWKPTALYRSIRRYFHPEEYILADKAYALERHIITPYKEPAAKHPLNATFNHGSLYHELK